MSWEPERVSLFHRLRMLPTPVQVTGVITAGVVVIDLVRSLRDVLLPIVQLVRGIGSCG